MAIGKVLAKYLSRTCKLYVTGLVVIAMVCFVHVHQQVRQIPAWGRSDDTEVRNKVSSVSSVKSTYHHTIKRMTPRYSTDNHIFSIFDFAGKRLDKKPNIPQLNASSTVWDGRYLEELRYINGTAMDNTFNPTTKHTATVGTAFHPPMTTTDRVHMAHLLSTFARVADANNVTYFPVLRFRCWARTVITGWFPGMMTWTWPWTSTTSSASKRVWPVICRWSSSSTKMTSGGKSGS